MTDWQIKGLKLEESALKYLDAIFTHHSLLAIIGVAGLCVLLFVWVLRNVSRRKARGQVGRVLPVIMIGPSVRPRPAPETFDPFPPVRDCDCHHERSDD